MRIVIDISHSHKIKTGIGTYTDNIIKNLKKIDSNNHYFYWKSPSLFRKKNFLTRLINALLDISWRQIILPLKLLFQKIDIYYSPAYYSPLLSPAKIIVVIHDLIFLKFKKEYHPLWYYYLKFSTKISVKGADIIITPSQYTKKDILENYKNINTNKIKVIQEAPGENFRIIENQAKIEEFMQKYNLRNKFLLYVGGLTKHKNIEGLLKIFAEFKKDQNNFENKQYKLIIVGPKDIPLNISNLTDRLDLKEDIIFTDFIPKRDLVLFYNTAELLLFPSLYEGFGLTPLEAMSCGCPVVSSNVSSLTEVIEEAGILINPENTEEFVQAIKKVIENNEFRDSLIEKGLKRSKKFTWNKAALGTLNIFSQLKNN